MIKKLYRIIFLIVVISLSSCSKEPAPSSKNEGNAAGQLVKVASIKQNTYLKNNWKYIFDDNKDYSEAQFDDSSWLSLNLPKAGFPFELKKSEYCWLRTKFIVSKIIEGQSLGLYIGKLPDACEIYFNGSIIETSGAMPPESFFSAPNIARSAIIPAGLINYEGTNALSIRVYMMRKSGSFPAPFITDKADMKRRYLSDFVLNSVISMIASILSVFLCLYFALLYIREPQNRFNLHISMGFPLLAIYFSTIYLETFPVQYLLLVKIQSASLYIGLTLFMFYFQGFYGIHNKKNIKVVLLSISLICAFILFLSPDLPSFEFINSVIFNLGLIVPILFYILIISIIAIRRGNKYASLLFAGIVLVIIAGVRDILYASLALQPRFWLTSSGLDAFILSIFFSSANSSVDIHKESEEKSKKLESQTGILKNIFQNIKEIGEKVSETGKQLDSGITNATSAVEQMVYSNKKIIDNVKSEVNTVEKTARLSDIFWNHSIILLMK